MKFSWQSLNQFIDLKNIDFYDLINKLPLIGFEVDNIENTNTKNDKIIDLSVTSNRQDMLCIIGLARELGCILNQKLIKFTKYSQYNLINSHSSKVITTNNILDKINISNIRVNIIQNIKNDLSPIWLKEYLTICDIESSDLFNDIQNFIKLKWGYNILIIDISNIQGKNNNISIQDKHLQYCNINILNLSQKIENFHFSSIKTQKISQLLVCHYSKDYVNDDIINAYNETLYLIANITKCSIGTTIYYNDYLNINKLKNYQININKKFIQTTLGPINKKARYISIKNIDKILNQLNFNPTYNKYTKNFCITIPINRYNDLYRQIDIVEEIGRIYGYEYFLDKLPIIEKKGKISEQQNFINKIRIYFRSIGLHEVVNSSLSSNDQYNKNNLKQQQSLISLYNPLSEDQSILRESLIHNIIATKNYNIKQKNNDTEVFEIGRNFQKNFSTKQLNEQIILSGILGNKTFIKTSWKEKSSELTWFHAKGILEEFFEKLHINIEWQDINEYNLNSLNTTYNNYFNLNKTTIIKHQITQDILGLLGQVKSKLCNNNSNNTSTYIFEIAINKLLNTQKQINHLNYNFSTYSVYPKVNRDISIKISKEQNVKKIKQLIYQTNPNLIENITVFNEYNDMSSKTRNIGLRITYRSFKKTLDHNDIKNIDSTLLKFIQSYAP